MTAPGAPRRVAMLLSCDSFEKFFGGNFGLDRAAYVDSYRNDFAWSYGEALLRRGHDVSLYVLSYGPAEVRTASNGLKVRFLPLPGWLRRADSLLFRLQGLPGGRKLRDQVAYRAFRRTLDDALAADGKDLLYVQEIWTARAALLMRDARLPLIAADHGAPYWDGIDALRRAVFPRAQRLICQTDDNFRLARGLGGQATLIPNGVDTAFFTPGPAAGPRPRTILSVGRLTEPQKRFSDLIQATALLPGFTLLLAGTGPDEALLRKAAAQHGVADRVSFLGFVSDRAELRRLYREAGVFASSSAWEAVALVLLEAMSCGTPVVGTRIPSFETLLAGGTAGPLVPVGDPAALAAAITEAHTRAGEFGARARARVEEAYAAETLYDELSDIMKGCPALP